MSLLNINASITPTKEQRLLNLSSHIKQTAKQSFRQLLDIQRRGIGLAWESSAHTPQEIIDSLGDDAVKIFQYHGLLTDLIKELEILDGINADIKLPTNEFTITDGKITVGQGPYTAS